jgi:hypothetical protein
MNCTKRKLEKVRCLLDYAVGSLQFWCSAASPTMPSSWSASDIFARMQSAILLCCTTRTVLPIGPLKFSMLDGYLPAYCGACRSAAWDRQPLAGDAGRSICFRFFPSDPICSTASTVYRLTNWFIDSSEGDARFNERGSAWAEFVILLLQDFSANGRYWRWYGEMMPADCSSKE